MKPPDRLDITYLFYSLVLGWHHEAAEGFLGKVRTFRGELARVAQIMFVLVADRDGLPSTHVLRNRLSTLKRPKSPKRFALSNINGHRSRVKIYMSRVPLTLVKTDSAPLSTTHSEIQSPSLTRCSNTARLCLATVTLLSIKQLTHLVFTSPVDGGASCCRDMKGIGSIPPLEVSDSGLQLGFPNVTFVDYMVTRRMSLNASWQKLPAAEYIWKLAQQPRALLSVTDCRVVFVYLLSRVSLGMLTADAAVIDEDEEF
ncbi:hypothetical protein F5141DRAFT_1065426 [Pisolithus sp. B1]|nr:hypothetical protein F5141DRAFT_1065426 [Pisolithus sp. B1]